MKYRLSEAMREHLWSMLSHRRNPGNSVLFLSERTAQALVRRDLLKIESGGYVLDEKAARKALRES